MSLTGDPYLDALLITLMPIAGLATYYALERTYKNKGALNFFLFTIFLTEFYIVAQDPSVVAALYTSQGNYWFPVTVGLMATAFLILAYVFGKRAGKEIAG